MPPQVEPIERRVGVLLGWRCWSTDRREGLLRPVVMRGLVWKPRQPHGGALPALADEDQKAWRSAGDRRPLGDRDKTDLRADRAADRVHREGGEG
jgi:hypothetical protein